MEFNTPEKEERAEQIDRALPALLATKLKAELQKKDHLLRSVAHDLRNPLGGIASLADLLLAEEPQAETAELLAAIKEAADHSLKLVGELLASGEQDTLTALVNIHHLIEHSARLARHTLDKKNQNLELILQANNPDLSVDGDAFTRVIDNLISNAVKFTGQGGQITITTRTLSDGVQVMVRDNGVGIPEQLQHRIFEGRPEIRREGTAGELSHGLGLPICKSIIEFFGGTISLQSRAEKGTVFHIWLPGKSGAGQ